MFSLRQYQTDIINSVRDHMLAGQKSILVQAVTGAGKTALAAYMLGTAQAKGKRAAFLVHRRELVQQSERTFSTVGVPYGVIAAGFQPNQGARIQIGSVQTVTRRMKLLGDLDMIIWDECHHATAGMWQKIRAAYPNAFHIGLTATPWRLDGSGLKDYFKIMVCGPPIPWLIENKFLCPYEMYAPPTVDLAGIKTVMGDYAKDELAAAVDRPTITGDIVKHYKQHAMGRRALGFAVSVEHSKHLVAEFNANGIPAAHVDGNTAAEIRDGIFEDLRKGNVLVVFNVDLADEGFDCPAVDCVIMGRPTQSLGKYLQQVGPGLRYAEGKTCIILDHAGNAHTHGLPDEEREWSLEARERTHKGAPAEVGIRALNCTKCFRCQPNRGQKACIYCGNPFEVKGREITQSDGELVRLTPGTVTFDGPKETPREVAIRKMFWVFKKRGMKDPMMLARNAVAARERKFGVPG